MIGGDAPVVKKRNFVGTPLSSPAVRAQRAAGEATVASPYIERILKARVYDVAIESPLEQAARLSRRLGNHVLLKREDLVAEPPRQPGSLLEW